MEITESVPTYSDSLWVNNGRYPFIFLWFYFLFYGPEFPSLLTTNEYNIVVDLPVGGCKL